MAKITISVQFPIFGTIIHKGQSNNYSTILSVDHRNTTENKHHCIYSINLTLRSESKT